jgi:hypothetical protein
MFFTTELHGGKPELQAIGTPLKETNQGRDLFCVILCREANSTLEVGHSVISLD